MQDIISPVDEHMNPEALDAELEEMKERVKEMELEGNTATQ